MITSLQLNRLTWIRAAALFGMLFGLLTIISGSSVLFNAPARQAAGNYVEFVVWFNFLAGFAYVIAGIGLWRFRRWAVWLAGVIAGATLLVFVAFGLYVLTGAAYEIRTVGAMALRTMVWLIISAVAYYALNPTFES